MEMVIEASDIKKISCSDYLTSKGIIKAKFSGGLSFFLSPLRTEKVPSFAVNEKKNVWFDYGAGIGGDVIKLCMIIEGIDFKTAIQRLSGSTLSHSEAQEYESPLKILDVYELKAPHLIRYLRVDRALEIDLIKDYVSEVYFENRGRRNHAIGFKNDKGGYELRNKFLKISTSPKWFTTIPGVGTNTSIFEGFIDFLSAVSYFGRHPIDNIIVLNSVNMIKNVDVRGHIKYWGDNDKAGDECLAKINAEDKRSLFCSYKDFNEFLCATKSIF